jgi:hypothetical protein
MSARSRRSQNVAFRGPPIGDTPLDAPLGEQTARELALSLRHTGWTTTHVDLWRDAGWWFACTRDDDALDLMLVATLRDEWIAQIAPRFVPGFFGRLRGQKASASPEAMHDLAVQAHAALVALGYLDLRWCWDRPPGAGAASTPPTP